MQTTQTYPSTLSRLEREREKLREALPFGRDPWPGHCHPQGRVTVCVASRAPKRPGSGVLAATRPSGQHRAIPSLRKAAGSFARERVLRHSTWDGLLVALALGHSAVLMMFPSTWLIALGIWWNSNTVSHNFIHLPFFRSRAGNSIFSAYLTLLLGIPQTLWRDRHLAHHADTTWKARLTQPVLIEILLVVGLWTSLLVLEPRFFLVTYLPGYMLGLGLCYVQGHYEH